MSEETVRGPGYRRIVLLVAGLSVGLAVAWYAARSMRRGGPEQESQAEPPETIDTDTYLRPIEVESEPGTDERTASFAGFTISVETEPEEALVTIGGQARGESPVITGIQCRHGAKIQIRADKPGFRPALATAVCRKDKLVKLTLRLAR